MATTSVYLIFGEDEYLVSNKAKEIVDTLVPVEDRALGLEIIDGNAENAESARTAISQCEEAIQTLGLFCNRKVVWFRDVSFLCENLIGKSEAVKSRVNQLASLISSGLSAGQVLVITSPKVDKRHAFYKACNKFGKVEEFRVSEKSYQAEQAAEARLKGMLRDADLKMSSEVFALFMEKVGINIRQMVNEVEKLAVFMGDNKTVSRGDIEAVVCSSRESLAWDLADAFGRRDLARCLKTLRQLMFQKESPIGLIIGLSARVKDLMIFREALDKEWLIAGAHGGVKWRDLSPEMEVLFSEGFNKDPRKMHPYRAGLLAEQAKGFSLPALLRCQKAAAEAHVKLVSSRMPQHIVLELLLIRMLSAGSKRRETSPAVQ